MLKKTNSSVEVLGPRLKTIVYLPGPFQELRFELQQKNTIVLNDNTLISIPAATWTWKEFKSNPTLIELIGGLYFHLILVLYSSDLSSINRPNIIF